MEVARLPAPVWARYAAGRWAPPSLVAPRLISLPTSAERSEARVRAVEQPSRMVAMARVLAAWRAAERDLAGMRPSDERHAAAAALVAESRLAYHLLFAAHLASS